MPAIEERNSLPRGVPDSAADFTAPRSFDPSLRAALRPTFLLSLSRAHLEPFTSRRDVCGKRARVCGLLCCAAELRLLVQPSFCNCVSRSACSARCLNSVGMLEFSTAATVSCSLMRSSFERLFRGSPGGFPQLCSDLIVFEDWLVSVGTAASRGKRE